MAGERARGSSNVAKVLAGTVLGPVQVVFASTAVGKVLIIAFAVGLYIGIKTGSNQVLMASSVILGLLVADSLANFISMRRLRFELLPPASDIWAGEETVVELRVRNEKWLIPAGDITLAAGFGATSGRQVGGRGWIDYVKPGSDEVCGIAVKFPFRGEVSGVEMRATSAWPMGLLVDRRKLNLPFRCTVYPELGVLAPGFLSELGGKAELARRTKPNQLFGDTMGLREYRPGDSLRRVSWKASAHRGRLVVREFEESLHTDIIVALDCYLPRPALKPEMEWLISLAATLSLYAVASGWKLKVAVAESDGVHVYEVEGSGMLPPVLRCLATARGTRIDRSETLVGTLKQPGEENVPVVFLTLAPQPDYSEDVVVVNRNLRPGVFSLGKARQ
ncbi:MAG: DUF58 domain-containing protein [Planctomycetes bacterium]|nr:DUF58 domain-containing protein [Planctomycetota bacterium]